MLIQFRYALRNDVGTNVCRFFTTAHTHTLSDWGYILQLEIVITKAAPAFHNLFMVMGCVFDINTLAKLQNTRPFTPSLNLLLPRSAVDVIYIINL